MLPITRYICINTGDIVEVSETSKTHVSFYRITNHSRKIKLPKERFYRAYTPLEEPL